MKNPLRGRVVGASLVGIIIVSLFALPVAPARAAIDLAQLQAQVQALLVQVQALQAQLAQQVQSSSGGGVTNASPDAERGFCYTWNRNLRYGDGGGQSLNLEQDVRNLQDVLEKEGFPVQRNEKLAGSVFEDSTASAVTGFQEKYASEILAPNGLAHGNGYVGPSTRKKLNVLYGCKRSVSPPLPPFSSPSSSEVPVVMIDGTKGGGASQFVALSIKGFLTNRRVSYWTLNYSCPSGVSLDSGKGNGLLCDGKSAGAMTYWASQMADPTDDYLMLTAGAENKNPYPASISFSLTVHDASGAILGRSNVGVTLGALGTSNNQFVTESIKCVFQGSNAVQSCYAATQSGQSFKFDGVQTAGGAVAGYRNEAITWKSTCGGYHYQTIDGENDYAYFKCSTSQASPSITVLSPNGGEQWTAGDAVMVRWTSANVPVVGMDILFYDSTGVFRGIAYSVPNNGIYEWHIPADLKAGSYRVGVRTATDAPQYSVEDQSDSFFAIAEAAVPASLWTTDGAYAANIGSFQYLSWTVGRINALVFMGKLRNHDANVPSVKIGYTISGEPTVNYYATNLQFASAENAARFLDDYLGDANVGSFSASARAVNSSNFKGVIWQSGKNIVFLHANINSPRVDSFLREAFAVYSGRFAPATLPGVEAPAQPSLTITSPKGGETFAAGGNIPVYWETKNVPENEVLDIIRLRGSDGNETTLIERTTNDGGQLVQIPASTPVGKYTLEIKSYVNGNLVFGASNPFTITNTTSQPTVTGPTITPGRMTVNSGEAATINFTVPSNALSAREFLSCPVGLSARVGNDQELCNTWIPTPMIPSASTFTFTNNTGSELRAVPNFYIYLPDRPNYAVGVSSEITVRPASMAEPSITILSPNGGETYKVGDNVVVNWTSQNNSNGGVSVSLMGESGAAIVKNITSQIQTIADTGSYVWTIGSDILAGKYRIVVQTPERPYYTYDASDFSFTITAPASSGGGGGGGGGNSTSSSSGGGGGGGGSGGGGAATINLSPGNDYYFKGPVRLQQLSDGGFMLSSTPANRPDELLFFANNPPAATDSASDTYYRSQDGNWYKVGGGVTVVDASTQTSPYFVVRKNGAYAATTLTLPSSITYFGSTVMNASPRPWQ